MTSPAEGSEIRLAMLGMVDGNGHPYSWSAICNGGFDADAMADCGYPVIPEYLAANRAELGIPGARVSHVWTEDSDRARHIAKASLIQNVVEDPRDVLGEVDAVCIPTDIGAEHVDRARPFIEAGVPVFIDKPLTDNEPDLRQFMEWYEAGKPVLSTSCMRYARELHEMKGQFDQIGEPRLITGITPKTWERYGIHALEGLYQLTGPGFVSVRNVGTQKRNTVLLTHRGGFECVLWAFYDALGSFGIYNVYGTKDSLHTRFRDTFHAFKTQLESFVAFVRTGKQPFPSEQTFELMRIIVAGIRSRERDGEVVDLASVAR